jgi:hypothetical protein
LRGFIRVGTPCASHSNKSCRYAGYTYQIDFVNLGDLEFVERSNKIRVEKLLNGIPIILGEYNAVSSGFNFYPRQVRNLA